MDYIRVEHNLYSFSKLFIPQVIMPLILSTNSERKPTKTITHVLEPIYRSRVLNTGTCIQQGDLFYSAGQHRKKLGEDLEKSFPLWFSLPQERKKTKRLLIGNIDPSVRLIRLKELQNTPKRSLAVAELSYVHS